VATAERDYGVVVAESTPLSAGRIRVRLDAAASAERRRKLGAQPAA
jgi:hypothetical protein